MAGMVHIPNINYRQAVHPYAQVQQRRSLRHSETAHDSERLIERKCQLRMRLNSGKLSGMPMGFPFHYPSTGHGQSGISYDSYEFYEELSGAAYRANSSRQQSARISFTRERNGYFLWQAHLPGAESHGSKSAAQVHVDPAVSQTPFWKSLHSDPLVIMRALGISLELDRSITIRLADGRYSNAVVYCIQKEDCLEPYFILRT